MIRIRNIMLLFFLSSVICISAWAQKKMTEKNTKPNIIIFLTDDQGYNDLGCYGTTHFKTPHIDQMAKEGTRFSQFYMAAPVCTPSRAALLTGKYPKRTGTEKEVIYPYSTWGLSPNEVTIAELLKPLGYKTACIGKWHLGNQLKYLPNNQGFDFYYGVPYSNDMDEYYYKEKNYQSPPLPVYVNQTIIRSGPNQDSLTYMWTKGAIDFIKQNSSSPFFLYLAHNMPHDPWHASKNFQGSSHYSLYGDAIQEIDWSMGEIINVLKQQGILDNTLILFTSDNGPLTKLEHGGSAFPLRGGKTTTWEGGLRVPCIAYWPGKVPPNVVSDEPMTAMDFLPTIVNIAGGNVPKSIKLDGADKTDLLFGKAKKSNTNFDLLYYGRDGGLEAYREGKWKLHIAKKLGWDKNDGPFPISLYNLDIDKEEKNNVANQFKGKVKKMKKAMTKKDSNIIPGEVIQYD